MTTAILRIRLCFLLLISTGGVIVPHLGIGYEPLDQPRQAAYWEIGQALYADRRAARLRVGQVST